MPDAGGHRFEGITMATPINTQQPGLGLIRFVAQNGIVPSAGDGTGLDGAPNGGFIGIIGLTAATFAPSGAFLAQGQSVSTSTYSNLFAIVGTTHGGDGIQNFLLPDLRARIAIEPGQGTGLANNHLVGDVTGA